MTNPYKKSVKCLKLDTDETIPDLWLYATSKPTKNISKLTHFCFFLLVWETVQLFVFPDWDCQPHKERNICKQQSYLLPAYTHEMKTQVYVETEENMTTL